MKNHSKYIYSKFIFSINASGLTLLLEIYRFESHVSNFEGSCVFVRVTVGPHEKPKFSPKSANHL